MKSRQKSVLTYVFYSTLTVLAVAALFFFGTRNTKPQLSGALEQFSQCLTDRGVKMYGTDWCSACKTQKNLFGRAFKNVTYIQCDKTPQFCVSEKIESLPTWVLPNGARIVGVQTLEQLAEVSQCPYTP